MKFDRKTFFQGFRDRIDPTIEQEQVDGLEFILGRMENDPFWKHIPQIAYALATVFHETAGSFQPVEEGYYLGAKAKAHQKKLRYFPYYGRGYVQLTWKKNYEQAGKRFNVDLVGNPELAVSADISYKVLTYGMHQGWFTGKKLDDYIKGSKKDYVDARRIINGTDKAGLIAGYARSFEKILTSSAAAPADPSSSRGQISPEPTKTDSDKNTPPSETPIVPAQVEAVPVQTVAPAESTIDTHINKWSARFVAVPAIVVGWVGAFFAWLKDSPANITIALVAAAALVGVAYVIGRQIKEGRDKKLADAEKQRQHEIQLALIRSAADKDKNTVALVPPPVPVGNPVPEEQVLA